MPFLERQNAVSEYDVDYSLNDDIRSHEQRHIIGALENNNGARCHTTNDLDISEYTLRYKIRRFREQGVEIPEKVGKKSA
jgi:two-component system response regulator FlrC